MTHMYLCKLVCSSRKAFIDSLSGLINTIMKKKLYDENRMFKYDLTEKWAFILYSRFKIDALSLVLVKSGNID